jgi:hypothetical protein
MALLQEDDDFFGDGDDNSTLRQCTDGHEMYSGLAMAEAAAVESKHENLGYHAAYDEYKDVKVQDGFEVGYTGVYKTAYRIGELLGDATMAYKLDSSNGDEENDGAPDPDYLAAAKKIRGVLTDKKEKEESTWQTYDLLHLQQDVEKIIIKS